MENSDVKHLSFLIERQGKLLERIATAADRTNQVLYALLSPQQRESLALEDHARLRASHAKPKT